METRVTILEEKEKLHMKLIRSEWILITAFILIFMLNCVSNIILNQQVKRAMESQEIINNNLISVFKKLQNVTEK